jgi:hypothetical protein
MLTFNAALNRIFEDGSFDIMFAKEYAEPGYSNPAKGILFANWNDEPLKRLGDLAEKAGYAIEWSDEWSVCDDCGKAVRTSPNSYGWRRSYFDSEDGFLCVECVRDDPSAYLESLEGNPRAAETLDIPLDDYVQAGTNYEHGWHQGQNDSPDVIATSLRARGITRFLFKLDDVGQFDCRFSVYVHQDEKDLLTDAPVESALPYDPGTELGKALRGEHSDVYHMETKLINPRNCPHYRLDADHYNEDGTCQCKVSS